MSLAVQGFQQNFRKINLVRAQENVVDILLNLMKNGNRNSVFCLYFASVSDVFH